MSRTFHRGLLTVFLASLSFAALPAISFANHSWGKYHWSRTSNPFTLKLGNNVSSKWDPYLTTTSTEWKMSSVLDTTIVAGGTKPRTCKPTRGRVEVCSEKYGFNGWLGLAQISISGSHITQGITKLNDSYFNTAKYNTDGWRNLVMCQEIGHTFGLDHQDENFNNENLGTCMDYTSNPDALPENWFPNAHDYEQLETIYTHLDTTTTVGLIAQKGGGARMSPPFADIDSDEPVELGTGQWGQLIRSTNHGRTEVFELDLGAGRKVLTRVIWAEPEEEPGPQQGRR